MFTQLLTALRRRENHINVCFIKHGGWLSENVPAVLRPPKLPVHSTVEKLAERTQAAGERPLWEGYRHVANYPHSTEGTRTSDQVRTKSLMGRAFSWLARSRKDPQVLEFGTAFGVSGMYWLAGIGNGHLYTFEPNSNWAEFANRNLSAVSPQFTLVKGTFESEGPRTVRERSIDIAFVDAIHTSEFVNSQLAVLKPLMKPGGLILFDDINFSDDMRACWERLAGAREIRASASLRSRVGIVELP